MILQGKKNAITTALALLLASALLLCAFPMTASASSVQENGTQCALTVIPAAVASELAAELAEVPISVDVYEVAAVDMTGGAYAFTFTDAFAALPLTVAVLSEEGEATGETAKVTGGFSQIAANQAIDAETWRVLAQDAAKKIKDGGVTPVATLSIGKDATAESRTASSLDKGLYLMIARTDASDYWYEDETAPSGEGGETVKTLCSVAYSENNNYLFLPQLISLPYKGEFLGDGKTVMSSDEGDWVYELTVFLKPEPQSRNATLEIQKTLSNFFGKDEAIFVFNIVATVNGKTVFSDVQEIRFTTAGTKTVSIPNRIPIGAMVTVTESYSGAHYKPADGGTFPVVVGPCELTEKGLELATGQYGPAAFSNTHDGSDVFGGGIVNHYSYNGEGIENPVHTDDTVTVTEGGNAR